MTWKVMVIVDHLKWFYFSGYDMHFSIKYVNSHPNLLSDFHIFLVGKKRCVFHETLKLDSDFEA